MARDNQKYFEKQIEGLFDWEQLKADIEALEPKDRVSTVLRLLEFCVGKKQSISQDISGLGKDKAEMIVEKLIAKN